MADCVLCQPQSISSGISATVFDDRHLIGTDTSCLGQSDIENIFVRSLVHVLKAYGMHAQEKMDLHDMTDIVYVSGGLQQYLIRTRKKEENSIVQPRKGYGSHVVTFHDLPDSVQLHIFSYLSASDLCRLSCVCSNWLVLGTDNLLWKGRLLQDINSWSIICYTGNPDDFEECESDLSTKEIYLQCSPDVRKCIRQQNFGVHNFSQFVRSFMPKKVPKLVMFGPGLESDTSGLVRKILEGESQLFKTTGMFPGQFEGIGSGFTMKMNSVTFNLVTLYTSSKSERHSVAHNQRLQVNRMLVRNNNPENSADSSRQETYEVRPAIKELSQSADGFIFVVDTSMDTKEAIESAQPELYSIVNESWTQATAPVLVLSCAPTSALRRHSCMDVVRNLDLKKFNRPWQAHNCEVDTLNGIEEGISWIVARVHRR